MGSISTSQESMLTARKEVKRSTDRIKALESWDPPENKIKEKNSLITYCKNRLAYWLRKLGEERT